eukprot:gb/GFBE01024941.1/.p1 GENE.gb/GFBE01024941.1/~~gb/GFBE01024941.1/.p1  ORF type:complete len:231 (+),score=49.73 gb/GFBE01024941.1/:1-693(+)
MASITRQFHYGLWNGGCCELSRCLSGTEIRFTEGERSFVLKPCSDGWWEGPPEEGLRVRLEGSHLRIQRLTEGTWERGFLAASSSLVAAKLCYAGIATSAGRKMGGVLLPAAGKQKQQVVPESLLRLNLGNLFGLGASGQDFMPRVGQSQDVDPEVCVVCMDLPANVCFNPCGHCVVCNGCEQKLQQKRCPICREPCRGSVKLAWSREEKEEKPPLPGAALAESFIKFLK